MIEHLQIPHRDVYQAAKVSCSYRKLVYLCVWILFVWYHKLEFSCFVVFRDEGSFEVTAEMLSRENRTNPLTWEIM